MFLPINIPRKKRKINELQRTQNMGMTSLRLLIIFSGLWVEVEICFLTLIIYLLVNNKLMSFS